VCPNVLNFAFTGGMFTIGADVQIRPPPDADSSVVQASEWKVKREDLEAAITPRSKILLLNTPHKWVT
jgi:aspartate/methionine/tyrosine aminotransferase